MLPFQCMVLNAEANWGTLAVLCQAWLHPVVLCPGAHAQEELLQHDGPAQQQEKGEESYGKEDG